MDWRCGRDQDEASPQAEDRPPGRRAPAEVATRESLSANLGTESGESRSAATALAPASAGTEADTDHESAAGRGGGLRLSPGEKTCQRTATITARDAALGSLVAQPRQGRTARG